MAKWKDTRTKPIWGDCNECGIRFDFRYAGLINGKKDEFCSHECFEAHLARVIKGMPEPMNFDDL